MLTQEVGGSASEIVKEVHQLLEHDALLHRLILARAPQDRVPSETPKKLHLRKTIFIVTSLLSAVLFQLLLPRWLNWGNLNFASHSKKSQEFQIDDLKVDLTFKTPIDHLAKNG